MHTSSKQRCLECLGWGGGVILGGKAIAQDQCRACDGVGSVGGRVDEWKGLGFERGRGGEGAPRKTEGRVSGKIREYACATVVTAAAPSGTTTSVIYYTT